MYSYVATYQLARKLGYNKICSVGFTFPWHYIYNFHLLSIFGNSFCSPCALLLYSGVSPYSIVGTNPVIFFPVSSPFIRISFLLLPSLSFILPYFHPSSFTYRLFSLIPFASRSCYHRITLRCLATAGGMEFYTVS